MNPVISKRALLFLHHVMQNARVLTPFTIYYCRETGVPLIYSGKVKNQGNDKKMNEISPLQNTIP